jgi:hypothetical protein
MVTVMNRTIFLVDGFNLYHSLRAASDDLGGVSTKWLDLPRLLPAVRSVRANFPTKRIWFLFPYKRKNNELAKLADGHCNIKKERYTQHQFPQAITLRSGRVVMKPTTW